MKKYFSLILLVLVCCTMLLSGCNLTSMDVENYNAKIVAKYGTMEINKKELNLAYGTNGSSYTSQGMSAEDAVREVINDVIDRKLLIDYSKKTYGVISISESEYNALNEQQKAGYTKGPYNLYVNNNKFYDFNTAITSVYDYINEQVLEFENDIRVQKGLDKVASSETESTQDDTSEFDGFTKYESSLTISNGNIVKKVKNNTANSLVGEFVLDVYGNENISNEALHRYLIKVRNSNTEIYNGYTKYADLLKAHILELFPTHLDNRYATVVQEEYEKQLPLETETILTYYKNKVEESYTKYNTINGYNQYVADMQSDPSKVFWHYEGERGFILTTHVLIKFDDATVSKLKNLKTRKDDGAISEEYYNQQREAILSSQGTYLRDVETGEEVYKKDARGEYVLDNNGNKIKEFYTYSEIFDMIKVDLSQYDNIDNDYLKAQKKAEAFNKYVYMFGMDAGSINASHYYACNLDTSVKDSLVENYANTAREIYKEQGIGSLAEPVLVEADNYSGYHIIFVVNDSKNLVSYSNLNNITIEALYNERPMLGINKTTLDVVYDAITKQSYDSHHNSLIARLRKEFAGNTQIELELFPYNYKSLIEE